MWTIDLGAAEFGGYPVGSKQLRPLWGSELVNAEDWHIAIGQSGKVTLKSIDVSSATRHLPFGILLIQVDHMDQYRAARGPGVAHSILRIVAQSVENCVRPTDVVGCWDENQFIAILQQCRESEVALVGERVRRMIGQSEIEWWGDKFSVTSPVGGAGCRPGDSVELLIARAAASVTESIGKGGNCVTVLS